MTSVEHWHLPDGTPLTLRPVRAQDAAALGELIQGLPARDRRWRFHGAVNGATPERLQHMSQPDPRHELALVAVVNLTGRDVLIADARCAVDDTGHGAELGLMVAAAWRRHGVGSLVLSALQSAANVAGLRWLYGSVMADNAPMLALMRHSGFLCTPSRGDDSLVAVEARVDSPVRIETPGPSFLAARPWMPQSWRWPPLVDRPALQS